ncbi:nicotinate phosphoribosyltransferase [Candidatus Nanohaloarchaea archaeon]|nr:nicotinate phosphoribosyltransferase [Candidatus Nanohaloarchaea archaeon]
MSTTQTTGKFELPENHEKFTDKYFLRSKEILEKEGLNPEVAVKVFARGEGEVAGLEEAEAIVEKYSESDETELHVTEADEFETKDPLMVLKGPAQDVIDLETMYLGAVSHGLTAAHPEHETVDPEEFGEAVGEVTDIYDVPLLEFGARHYHWSDTADLARAAYDNGAVATSTDVGAATFGEEGVGTTPHALTIMLGEEYGEDNATRKTAELFDEHMDEDIPRTTLVDTWNQEIDDALETAEYFENRDVEYGFRVDTCGENIAQGGREFDPEAEPYETGTGVRIESVKALKDALVENGYDDAEIVLSSGFGNPKKAEAFHQANLEYEEENGEKLFDAVGAGAFSDGIYATADIYEVDGEEFSKVGREADAEAMDEYVEDQMRQVI